MTLGAFAPLAVEAIDLACSRGGRRVFSNLSFKVEAGRFLAVTGPNGAGKSSLLRLVAGLLRPADGTIRFAGRAEDDSVAHYLGHSDALKPALTLRETLRFWSVIYGGHSEVARSDDIDECAKAVGLGHTLDLPTGVLSAGQRRRAALARLILSPRPLWLLDEPASALDRDGEALLGRLIEEHLSRDGLILAATHQEMPVAPHASMALGGPR